MAGHLRGLGYEILDRNVRVGPLELDVIARRGNLLVICEVRTLRGTAPYSPVETITPTKVSRVRRAAARWLSKNRPGTDELRFDAAAVTIGPDGPTIDYYEDAF
ncbi:MAG: YraN family protein [Myxococcales bacterium]|nr:YraN family protein [Myxococcales bacterium]